VLYYYNKCYYRFLLQSTAAVILYFNKELSLKTLFVQFLTDEWLGLKAMLIALSIASLKLPSSL
jgi:hypothetical protein